MAKTKKKYRKLPPIGPVGGGLFHIGEGCFTGLGGYLQFEEAFIEEIKKEWKIDD
jgi:hypothetical protein